MQGEEESSKSNMQKEKVVFIMKVVQEMEDYDFIKKETKTRN